MRHEQLSLRLLPLFGRPSSVRLGLCDTFLGLGPNGHAGQLGQANPHALVADRRPDGVLRPLSRPQGGRHHGHGCFGQDAADAGLPARVAEAEQDPVGEPRATWRSL